MMTAEQLKNSILQLALQGKLVPQDKDDEPAQALLKRVREKKKMLIKTKAVPQDKKMEEVSEDEQLFEIPESWVWTRIGELFQHNTGKALNGSNKEGTVLPYITTSNLYWNRFELDNLKEMPFTDAELDKCTATKGDLLVCEGGDYGRAAIWSYDFDIRIQNHVHKLRAYEELCTEYFYYVFNFLKSTGQIKGKGIAIQGLSSGVLHNLVIPLPPLNEQYRIVERIHAVVPEWEKYAVASTKLNTLNSSFPDQMKKSILQEAVQGKLVPQDPNDEPASALLKKIAEEKKRLIKERKIKKQKPLPEITEDEIPFEIPESWEWVRFGSVMNVVSARRVHQSDWKKRGIPFYRAREIAKLAEANRVENELYISEDLYKEFSKSGVPKPGDLMVTGVGTLGKTYVVKEEDKFYYKDASVLCFENFAHLDPYYIKRIMESPLMRGQIKSNSSGTTVATLTMVRMVEYLIPLPPLAEQKRIAMKIEELIPFIEELNR